MTTNKRKRECEVGEEEQQVNDEVGGSPLKPPQLKKPHNTPSEIVLSAIEKIAQLERYMNEQVAADEDTDSDYSDLSDVESECGRFDTNSNDNAKVLATNRDSPVIRETAKFNPEIVGFAICAQETMNFLRKEGFPEDDPLMVSMQNRLLHQLSDYQDALKRGSKWGRRIPQSLKSSHWKEEKRRKQEHSI